MRYYRFCKSFRQSQKRKISKEEESKETIIGKSLQKHQIPGTDKFSTQEVN